MLYQSYLCLSMPCLLIIPQAATLVAANRPPMHKGHTTTISIPEPGEGDPFDPNVDHTKPPWYIHEDTFYTPVCETSNASPSLKDAQDGVLALAKKNSFMCLHQHRPFDSGCSTIYRHKSAAFGICGKRRDVWLRCGSMSEQLSRVAEQCKDQEKGKVGGKIHGSNTVVESNKDFWLILFANDQWKKEVEEANRKAAYWANATKEKRPSQVWGQNEGLYS